MKDPAPKWVTPEIQRMQSNRLPGRKPEETDLGPTSTRWTEFCWLKLETDVFQQLENSDRWKLLVRDPNGETIFRQCGNRNTIPDRDGNRITLDPKRWMGSDPRNLIIHLRSESDTQHREIVLEIPDSFRRRYSGLLSWVNSHRIPERTASFCPLGGLANQLYQAAAMLGYAWRNGADVVCEVWKTDSPSMVKRRPTYWDTVFAEIVKLGEGLRRDPWNSRNYGDPSFTYSEIPARHQHQILWGHFLSYKYFHSHRERLLDLLWGNSHVQREVEAAYKRLTEHIPPDSGPLVSIHVRRGDSLRNSSLTLMNMGYWEEAMAQFPGAVFAVFSDDLPWCRERFRGHDIIFADGNPDYVDLYLMARCDHHIIVNSTFSWWSAYLNRKVGRQVVYPVPWFAKEKRKRDMRDFFPPDWNSIEVHEE